MVASVHHRTRKVRETGVDKIEEILRLLLDRANLSNEVATLGDDITPRFDLESNAVSEFLLELRNRLAPQRRELLKINELFPGLVRNRQSAAATNRLDLRAQRANGALHRAAYGRQVFEIRA